MGDLRKSRDVEQPWATFVHDRADWEWRILKAYSLGKGSAKNEYSRFYCAVMSPHTFGSWEYGDVYVREVLEELKLRQVSSSDEFEDWLSEYKENR